MPDTQAGGPNPFTIDLLTLQPGMLAGFAAADLPVDPPLPAPVADDPADQLPLPTPPVPLPTPPVELPPLLDPAWRAC